MTQLKPCPFCGGAARASNRTSDERSGYQTTVNIYCVVCKASVSASDKLCKNGWSIAKEGETFSAAAEKWNLRTEIKDPDYLAYLEWINGNHPRIG